MPEVPDQTTENSDQAKIAEKPHQQASSNAHGSSCQSANKDAVEAKSAPASKHEYLSAFRRPHGNILHMLRLFF
jgi:hypothetical protein